MPIQLNSSRRTYTYVIFLTALLLTSGCVRDEVGEMAKLSAVITAQNQPAIEFADYYSTSARWETTDPYSGNPFKPNTKPSTPEELDRQELKTWLLNAHKVLANYYAALAALANEEAPVSTDDLTAIQNSLEKLPPSILSIKVLSADKQSAIILIADLTAKLMTDAYKNYKLKGLIQDNHEAIMKYLKALEELSGYYTNQLTIIRANIRTFHSNLAERILDTDKATQKSLTGLMFVLVKSDTEELARIDASLERINALSAAYKKIQDAEVDLKKHADENFWTWKGDTYNNLKNRSKELKSAYAAVRTAW